MADVFTVNDKSGTALATDVPAPVTLTGLTSNTVYSGWTATKNDGKSTLNVPDQTTTPEKPSVTATAGDATATVQVAKATNDGDAPLTAVTVSYQADGATDWTTAEADVSTLAATLSGLTNGTAYTVKATVTNASGTSAESDITTVTPTAPTTPAA